MTSQSFPLHRLKRWNSPRISVILALPAGVEPTLTGWKPVVLTVRRWERICWSLRSPARPTNIVLVNRCLYTNWQRKTVTSSAVLCVQSQAIDLACRTPNWRLWLTACWLPPQGHSILVSRNGYFYSLLHNLRNTNLHCAAKLTVHFKSWQTKCCYFDMYRTASPYCSQHYEKVLLAGLSRYNS